MSARNILTRGFFTAKAKHVPRLFAVGSDGLFGYHPEARVKALRSDPVLSKFSDSAVATAISFIDMGVEEQFSNSVDYVLGVNSALVAAMEEQVQIDGTSLSEKEVEDIMGITSDVHENALKAALTVSSGLVDAAEAVARGDEDCKLAIIGNAGPMLKEIIERDFEKIHQLFEGNIIFSNDVGNSFSHDGDSFRSVASKMFVEPKDVFFVDKSAATVKIAQKAGCLGHFFRGSTLLQEELARVGLTYKKNPITGKITEKV